MIFTFLFLKLSMVKILPKAVVHKKKATLKGTLNLQMIFQK